MDVLVLNTPVAESIAMPVPAINAGELATEYVYGVVPPVLAKVADLTSPCVAAIE